MRNGRSRRSAQVDTAKSTATLDELSEETCPECHYGDCGPRCPKCCQMIESFFFDDRGRYRCHSCPFVGSPRLLRAELILAGRVG